MIYDDYDCYDCDSHALTTWYYEGDDYEYDFKRYSDCLHHGEQNDDDQIASYQIQMMMKKVYQIAKSDPKSTGQGSAVEEAPPAI